MQTKFKKKVASFITIAMHPRDSPDEKLDPWHGGEPWRGRIAIPQGWLVAGLESVLCTTKPSRGPGPHNGPKACTPGNPVNPNPIEKIQGYSPNPGPWKVPQLPLSERQCKEWIPTSQAKPFRIALSYLAEQLEFAWFGLDCLGYHENG